MALSLGTRLGPYEVTAQIGVGGMGEVYRATDTNLKRSVAIKVLPASVAGDAERLARFQREAEVLAALNHPSIAAIYGLERSGATTALVMELVEGPTLADRIALGAIPIDEALPIAKQIAEALEAAHEQGIIHRDLKPANIKVRADGTVKVLDFGLAKAMEPPAGSSPSLSQSPTITTPAMTQAGMILGTAAYMSPEQARGKTVDKRADIWAFGVVLYEMVTGTRAFPGEDVTDTLAAVVKLDPKWDAVGAAVPSRVLQAMRVCLQKDLKQRIGDIHDVRLALEGAFDAPQAAGARSASGGRLAWMAALAVAVVTIVAMAVPTVRHLREAPLDRPLVRLDVDLGPDVSLDDRFGTNPILSPDGMRLVYLSQDRLFTRRLDQPKATELAGTEGARVPFFSPDGQWVAFWGNGKLRKISVEGGAVIVLCDAPGIGSGSWGEDGNIIATLGNNLLSRIPSAGGAPTPVTELAQGEGAQRWPQILPGGNAVLFTSVAGTGPAVAWDEASIEVVSLADRRRKTLLRGGTYGRYVPSANRREGHLIYVNRGTLFAVPFDLEALAVRGTPSPVLEQVSYSSGFGYAQFDFSQEGTLVYRSGRVEGSRLTVQWLDRVGKMQPLLAKPDAYQSARLSPDGQRLAISTTDLWVYEWQRDTMTRLTFGGSLGGNSVPAVWSPDGRYLIFRKSGEGLFWTRSDGAGQPQLLMQGTPAIWAHSFTPDGKRLAFREAGTGFDLWTMPVESDGAGLRGGKPEMFLGTQFNESYPAFSPDGGWLAYGSDEGGTSQIFVRAFPDRGGKWQISDSGGIDPQWSRNGRELFFRTADEQIAVAAYTVRGDAFVADKPRIWSETRLAKAFNLGSNYNLAPDGARVVVFTPAEASGAQTAQNQVIFLQHFFDELRRRVPLGK